MLSHKSRGLKLQKDIAQTNGKVTNRQTSAQYNEHNNEQRGSLLFLKKQLKLFY